MAYKGGARKKATLKYMRDVYTPEGAKSLTDRNLRKEYSRLRSIAQKRLQRFEGTEWTDSEVYKTNKDLFKPLSEIKSDRELRHLFSDVARFTISATGSVSGLERQRRLAIETLHDRNYDFVNKGNFKEFAEFMEYERIANKGRMYDSKRIAEFYEMHDKTLVTNDQLHKAFKRWKETHRQLKKIQQINPRNSTVYRSKIETPKGNTKSHWKKLNEQKGGKK
jgi:hypothetical protein